MDNTIKKSLFYTALFVFIIFLLYIVWFIYFRHHTVLPPLEEKEDEIKIISTFGLDSSSSLEEATLPDTPIISNAPVSFNVVDDGRVDVPSIGIEQTPFFNEKRLVKIFEGPTAGFFVPEGKNPIVVIKQGNGERYVIEKNTYALQQVDTPGVPKTVVAYPLKDGSIVIQQQNLINPKQTNALLYRKFGDAWERTFIGSDVALFPRKDREGFLYLKETSAGANIRSVNLSRNGSSHSFDSTFRSWRVIWSGETPFLLTKPHNDVEGFLYAFPQSSSAGLIKRVGPLPGLFAVFNDENNQLLISTVQNKNIETFVLDGSKKIPLEKKGLADKCVFERSRIFCGLPKRTPKGSLPEDWYQGGFFFDDNVVEIFPTSGRIRTTDSANEPIDVYKGVFVDPLFVFINKRDGSLWALNTSL